MLECSARDQQAKVTAAMQNLRSDDLYDQRLTSQVHPPDWHNPEPGKRYNLAVIGAGTAGLVCAAAAAGLGAKVALIERELMGGDCLNFGCVPSKALLRSARAYADVRRARDYGVGAVPATDVDFAAVMSRMRRLRAELSERDSIFRFKSLGVDVFLGNGRFSGPDSIEVDGRTLRFSRAVIATGSRAATLNIQGLAEAGFLTNETVFSLTALPKRFVVIGGGPVGCELAQAFKRFGTRVTLLEAEPAILPREDADAARIVKDALLRDGVEIIENCQVLGSQPAEQGNLLKLQCVDARREIAFDEILVAVGRMPTIDGLGLEAARVEYEPRSGIRVDDHLRTTNPRIFAAGDVCSAYKFTHMADAMARIAVRNVLFYGRERVSDLTIPWCTYTDPEIAEVGLSEWEARERGIAIRTFLQPLAEIDRAILDGETDGLLKVRVRQNSDRIVGATLVARHAGETVSELTLAIANGIGMAAIARTIHPYPTQAEAIHKIADAYNRTRLTPRVQWLFRKWLAWTR
jgi:pyruvate/2-oxoglutarate dehydrogenase complex dihydrolipoamide dehydrogenase (E3) component